MIAALLSVGIPLGYLLTVRAAYRYLITREPWKVKNRQCVHGFDQIHRGDGCHGTSESATRRSYLAASLCGPLLLVPAVIRWMWQAIEFAVTWKQPLSLTQQKEKETADKARREKLQADIKAAELELARITAALDKSRQ